MSRTSLTSHIRPISDRKREHEVLQYVAAYRDLPRLDLALGQEPSLPPDYHARLSTDSTLNALCQLAALRMNAQRALVSLIDDKSQHVLAEATPQNLLHGGTSPGGSNPLWLGSISIPRRFGVCEEVLSLDATKSTTKGRAPVIVYKDLRDSVQYARRTFVQGGPHLRFYAGAALLGPQGAVVGALCVFDDKPRENISVGDTIFLSDLSATVIEYLGNYTVKDRFKRSEKLTRGLISFAEGASALLPLDNDDQLGSEPNSPTTTASAFDSEVEANAMHHVSTGEHALHAAETGLGDSQVSQVESHELERNLSSDKEQHFLAGSATVRAASTRVTSLRALQDTILPRNSRSMFARAASVMLASSDLDGVLILDASVAATGHRQNPAAPEHERYSDSLSDSTGPKSKSDSSDESSSQSSNANQRSNSSSSKKCQILGSAPPIPIANADGTPAIESLAETNLALLLREHPHGKVFNFTVDGTSMSSTEDSSSNKDFHEENLSNDESRRTAHRRRASRSSKAISALLQHARSVAFVPFWDYERSRWFAGCLCWTNNPDRLLSVSVDLAYFTIFSHSIMRELSRLDAVALNQQKTTFVASISHELRSPLHGILGTLEFIRDTPLDTFQMSMLNSLNSCGQTLLDTINHVMDHSKMSETHKNVSNKTLKNMKTVRLSSKPRRAQRLPRDPAFDLCIATEEVVEAVFAGSSFLAIMSLKNSPSSPVDSITTTSTDNDAPDVTTKRKTCYIILDVAHEQDWVYCFPVGPWKRTVMNLFGNAIKYTQRGYVVVSLHAADVIKNTGPTTTVTLTITDTGTGMGPAFLANKVFQPFSQENSHSSGVGLGLSIVRQIIETNGGKIQVSSDRSTGTKITVKLSLPRPETAHIAPVPSREEYLSWLPRLQGRKVCILHRVESDQDVLDEPQNGEGLKKFSNALVATLANHLKMDVVQTTSWEDCNTDLVICPEPSFSYLALIREKRNEVKAAKAAVTIFVALDALEAATLRSDARVRSKESVVEIMTQPLGPYKLAYVLNKCLDRFESLDENVEQVFSPTNLRSPLDKGFIRYSPSSTLSPAHEMSPFLDQTHRSQTGRGDTPWQAPQEAHNPTAAAGATFVSKDGLPRRSETSTIARSAGVYSKILITDDNAINRRLLVAFMKKYNLQYTEAENGLEALRTYQSEQAHFDVILMDMSMPVMDGVSATRAIRQYEQEYNLPRCFIIAVTGLASASAKLEAWNSGIDHFMTKPVNFKQLEKFLRKVETKRGKITNTARPSAPFPASSGC